MIKREGGEEDGGADRWRFRENGGRRRERVK